MFVLSCTMIVHRPVEVTYIERGITKQKMLKRIRSCKKDQVHTDLNSYNNR